jgi:hypothetical protein
MTKISKSPGRLTFQKEKYVERREAEGKLPDPAYLEMFARGLKYYDERFQSKESQQGSLEYCLLTTDWILAKVRNSRVYAQNLYAAMCNNEFLELEVMPILKNDMWSCSWRYAGGIIADMCQEGDYIDWYCSGTNAWDNVSPEEFEKLDEDAKIRYLESKKFVGEGYVTDEVREDLLKLGWKVIEDDKMV